MRFANIPSGAKLELVTLSKSPSVVSVALQLPDSEAEGVLNGRLVDKFPSTTTLWMVLRKFEAGVAGGDGIAKKFNFTARGKPRLDSDDTSSGRIYHESPVVNLMGRDMVSFPEFQKTLGQLGLNSGSFLLRLSFKVTKTPLEVAMANTEEYFASNKAESSDVDYGARDGSLSIGDSIPAALQTRLPNETVNEQTAPDSNIPETSNQISDSSLNTHDSRDVNTPEQPTSIPTSSSETSTSSGPNQRPISVLAPPSSNKPHASLQDDKDEDFVPTISDLKNHISRLKTHGQNQRLSTDAEIAAKEQAQAAKRALITEVHIKLRFPDQTQVTATFSNLDTAAALYDHARNLIIHETEPFLLNFSSAKGPKAVPKDSAVKLISDLGMSGRVLVNFIWDAGASTPARSGKTVKPEVAARAKEIEVREPEGVEVDERPARGGNVLEREERGNGKGKGKGQVPKWMNKLMK